jgi:DNA-binding transcriptional regulator YiaG
MSDKKIQKLFTDKGFGFAIHIVNAPMIKVRGKWVLKLNFEKYEKAVLMALAHKQCRLSGNEIKFIRNYFELSLKEFGKRFGDVAHSAVIKWEKKKDAATSMNWACEKDIRLYVINFLDPSYLRRLYSELEEVASEKITKIRLEAKEIKAA